MKKISPRCEPTCKSGENAYIKYADRLCGYRASPRLAIETTPRRVRRKLKKKKKKTGHL